jgi:hypothetical protein
MEILSFGKIFATLALPGACFNELNRIQQEVLSVFAQ